MFSCWHRGQNPAAGLRAEAPWLLPRHCSVPGEIRQDPPSVGPSGVTSWGFYGLPPVSRRPLGGSAGGGPVISLSRKLGSMHSPVPGFNPTGIHGRTGRKSLN